MTTDTNSVFNTLARLELRVEALEGNLNKGTDESPPPVLPTEREKMVARIEELERESGKAKYWESQYETASSHAEELEKQLKRAQDEITRLRVDYDSMKRQAQKYYDVLAECQRRIHDEIGQNA